MAAEPREYYAKIVQAIEANDLEQLKTLFQTYPEAIELNTPLGNWVIMATKRSDISIVEYLISIGVDPKATIPASGRNMVAVAAQEQRIDMLDFAAKTGIEMDVSSSTCNPLIAAVNARSVEVAQYLLDAGIDARITYPVGAGPSYDATCFALEQGARDVARAIVLHIAGGDRAKAQTHLDRAWEAVKANNPEATSIPAEPVL